MADAKKNEAVDRDLAIDEEQSEEVTGGAGPIAEAAQSFDMSLQQAAAPLKRSAY